MRWLIRLVPYTVACSAGVMSAALHYRYSSVEADCSMPCWFGDAIGDSLGKVGGRDGGTASHHRGSKSALIWD